MERPTFIVIDPNLELARATCELLSPKGDAFPTVELKGVLRIQKQQGHVDAILLDVDATEDLSGTVERLHRVYPTALLYVTGERIPVSLWGPLVELGVRDLVSHPLTARRIAQLVGFDFESIKQEVTPQTQGPPDTAMSAVAARRQLDHKPTYSRVICVTSPKGGEGRTTLVTHLASHYAKHGPVVIIDADAQGDIANAFRLDVSHTIAEIDSVKSEKAYLDTLLAMDKETGIRILPSPVGERMNHISRKQLERAIIEYRRFYPVILIDLPQGFLPLHRTALDFATQYICVVTPDTKRYQRVEEYVRKLRTEGGEPGVSAVEFVLNYNKPYSKIEDRPVRALLQGYKVTGLPYDRSLMQRIVGKKLFKACKVLEDEQVDVVSQVVQPKKKWRGKRA
ncbi:AAA family ATPase [Alicyclobacillus sp. SO9]|uniref:AAA family ATPase n=1 Tax=Alicyclobacillus sp. SO9 TaxID=2665646 RepID=UPI0018E84A49|nr:AAA family ATPase [Alicyclobacillus sp. SO9]QQE79701.1 AAA family ATPase [Alicyclobacillus sp. SO9]